MIITPKQMREQNGKNKIKRTLADRLVNITCAAPPAPVAKLCGKKLRRRERVEAKQREKRRAMPMFSAELCEPPQAVLYARAAFAKAAKCRNPRPSAPVLEIIRPAESDSGSPVSAPSGAIPHLATGIALNPDNGEPLSDTATTALKLVKHLDKKKAAKARTSCAAMLKGFRKGRAAAYSESLKAFETSLDNLRTDTKARIENGKNADGSVIGGVNYSVGDTFKTAEARMILSAKKLLESFLAKPVPVYSANLYREAIESYFTSTKQVHTESHYPVTFDAAPRDFSGSFERAYYGMLILAGVKEVMIVGGVQNGNTMNIKVAAMLRSYELLIPALDSDD